MTIIAGQILDLFQNLIHTNKEKIQPKFEESLGAFPCIAESMYDSPKES